MNATAGLPNAGIARLVCGLANPGEKHARERHNAGAWLIEGLAAKEGVTLGAVAKLPAVSATTSSGVRLAVPTTYMNDSGVAVGQLARYFKIEPANLLIAHDEIDLEPGVVRFKFGGGHAGHNGLRDIIKHLGSGDFWRLRIGVGHPRGAGPNSPEVVSWVLAAPPAGQRAAIDSAIEGVVANWTHVAAGDMDAAMRAIHQRAAG